MNNQMIKTIIKQVPVYKKGSQLDPTTSFGHASLVRVTNETTGKTSDYCAFHTMEGIEWNLTNITGGEYDVSL